MAEFLDDFSDLESESDEECETLIHEFNKAADHVPKIASTLDSSILLQIYALYKQANEGPCDIPKPGWFRAQDKAKWEAWNSLKDMPQDIAMKKYIKLVSEVDQNWTCSNVDDTKKDKSQNWVAVSTLTDSESFEYEKNIFDYCKEGDLTEFSRLLPKIEKDLLDDNGMGLVHWAADRGHLQILRILLKDHDVNLKDGDGQTALHYAVSCGHNECVKFLLDHGVDKDVRDTDGMLAVELTDDNDIRQFF